MPLLSPRCLAAFWLFIANSTYARYSSMYSRSLGTHTHTHTECSRISVSSIDCEICVRLLDFALANDVRKMKDGRTEERRINQLLRTMSKQWSSVYEAVCSLSWEHKSYVCWERKRESARSILLRCERRLYRNVYAYTIPEFPNKILMHIAIGGKKATDRATVVDITGTTIPFISLWMLWMLCAVWAWLAVHVHVIRAYIVYKCRQ